MVSGCAKLMKYCVLPESDAGNPARFYRPLFHQ